MRREKKACVESQAHLVLRELKDPREILVPLEKLEPQVQLVRRVELAFLASPAIQDQLALRVSKDVLADEEGEV